MDKMSRSDHSKSKSHSSKEHKRYSDDEMEELDYNEVDDAIDLPSHHSPREEGEALSEDGDASSDDNTALKPSEENEREYRRRLERRKAERDAAAAASMKTAHLPPRSKFDSPERSFDGVDESNKQRTSPEKHDIRTSASSGHQQPVSSSSNPTSGVSRDSSQDKRAMTGSKRGREHRSHHSRRDRHRSIDNASATTATATATSDAPSAAKKAHLSRSHHRRHHEVPAPKKPSTPPPPLEPSGALNTRLAPGRAPIIDGSQFKYLEELEDEEEEEVEEEVEQEGALGEMGSRGAPGNPTMLEELRADVNLSEDEEEEEEGSDHPAQPVKPFYFPSIQGCRSVDEFECLNRIEEGTYGVVYRARDKRTNEVVALKRLKMEKEKEGFPITSLREINTLMKAQHENIVTVREIVVGFDLDKIYLVMEYVEHDLKSLMEVMSGPFTVGQVKCLLIQLLRAVQHLHDNWILHRDLKTSNLLLSHKGILKVGDFGLAREYGSPLQHYTEIVVTLWYRSVELLLGCKNYSTPIDLWSVGCIFAEFLLQRPLFPGKGELDQINMIFRDLGTPNERIWPGCMQLPGMRNAAFADYPYNQLRRRFTEKQISKSGFELLTSFLTYCPERRITAESALAHPYFSERPQAIHPSMMPSWPAKSEGGGRLAQRPAGSTNASAAASAAAAAALAAVTRLREPAPPLGGTRFYAAAGGSARRGGGPNSGSSVDQRPQGFSLNFF